MAAMTTIALNQVSVWFAPVLFLVSHWSEWWSWWWLRLRAERILREGERLVNYHKLAATDTDTLLPWLKDNLRGHDQVIESIFLSLKKSVQLARPGRTLGNFLLVGPTGTGKTFLSQLVGSGLFPDSELVLLTMNQYKQPGDVYTLIGPPPGMPGYEVGGRLTRPGAGKPLPGDRPGRVGEGPPRLARLPVRHLGYGVVPREEFRPAGRFQRLRVLCHLQRRGGQAARVVGRGRQLQLPRPGWAAAATPWPTPPSSTAPSCRAGTACICWTSCRRSTWRRSPASSFAATGANTGSKSATPTRN